MVEDGAQCPGCGLANYEGLCPHCRCDQRAYEDELVPPFPTTDKPEQVGWEGMRPIYQCGFCKGKPVGNAATWVDGKPRPPAPCPRCGKVNT